MEIESHTSQVDDPLVPTRTVMGLFGYTSPEGLIGAAKAGRFPSPVQLPNRRYAWRQSDLDAFRRWLDSCPAKKGGAA